MRSGSTPWTQSRLAVLLAAVLFPPLGLVLVWKRPGVRIWWKALATVGIAMLVFAHLYLFWGLRVELDGSATWPIFSFFDVEEHYEAIERDRAAQRQMIPEMPEPVPPTEAPAGEETAKGEIAGQEIAEEAAPPDDAYWTDFRGPNRDGRYDEMEILTSWPPEGLPELWRKPIGGGFASFSIANGAAFTIEQRRDEEVVAAYDMETGRELWTNSWKGRFEDSSGGPGPRATPTWHDGKVYAQGALGELRCLDATTGSVLWRKNILEDSGAANTNWGIASSPLAVDGKVIVLTGGGSANAVLAYDAITGDRVWSVLDDRGAYASPMLATLAGVRQLVVITGERVAGLRVEDGGLLWGYPWTTDYDVNAAQPLIVDRNRLFVSSGYGHGAVLLEITSQDGQFAVREVWETNRMKNKFSASVLFEGHIYGLDESILACIGVDDGALQWKGGRYGYGQALLASGHLIITTERGDVVLVRPTPESHQEVARFKAVDGKTWNNPAIAGGKLLVRNGREVACYRVAP